MQKRHELGLAPLVGVEIESLDHLDRQPDDVAAVAARVGVVGLDDVAEQVGGAAVGVAELERPVDLSPVLAREQRAR